MRKNIEVGLKFNNFGFLAVYNFFYDKMMITKAVNDERMLVAFLLRLGMVLLDFFIELLDNIIFCL